MNQPEEYTASPGTGSGTGGCPCGTTRFTLRGKPLMRAYCHCLICQEFSQADYADVSVFYAKDVAIEDDRRVDYKVHQNPPLLKRGTCTECGKPAIEKLAIPLMPKMFIIPSANLNERTLPPSEMHIFYNRRKANAQDGLPKHDGFLGSQLAFGVRLVKAMLRGR